MGGQEPKKVTKRICAGLLAHVDAGKTTLSEGILYQTGTIRKLGRVDNRDAFLDTYELERARGITIFSKQAVFDLGDLCVTLLDTPGHVDFSAEMERTLQVLDCAVLVVSGADGVQGHTETLWRLLKRYRVPTFVFVNKMDQSGTDWEAVLEDLKKRLDENCVPFGGFDLEAPGTGPGSAAAAADAASEPVTVVTDPEKRWKEDVLKDIAGHGEEFLEELAMCDERVMETYLEDGIISWNDVCGMIAGRQVFPCFFGSALRLWGVEELLAGLERFGDGVAAGTAAVRGGLAQTAPAFGARVFKISRDDQGNRLTHMKITGGILKVKDVLPSAGGDEEKVNQIRIYSGARYETVGEADAGTVCAVTGPMTTYAGQCLGAEAENGLEIPMLEPVLTYQVILPPGCDVHGMLRKLRQLEEEEPMLHIAWNENSGEIQAQVMGAVQIEVLKSVIRERFGVDVEFGAGRIVYKETITAAVEGVGHFEPLRHYAEVHLLMEPAPRGSGLIFDTVCSTDALDLNWQRLILTHLKEKRHVGVLTGAAITDMKITLIAGRAHLKHTEGGDFRQATYRAVRQGLMEALAAGRYQLLEPWYRFRLEVPPESVGRALSDLERMRGSFEGPATEGGMAVITGKAPVAAMGNYQMEVVSYSRGKGRLHCSPGGYEPCRDPEAVAAAAGYEPELDLENPCGSVFCSHGAGYVVDWYAVKDYMHLESPLELAARRNRREDERGDAWKAAPNAEDGGAAAGGKTSAGMTPAGQASDRGTAAGKVSGGRTTAGSASAGGTTSAGAAAGGKTSAGTTPAGQAFDGGTVGETVLGGKTTAGPSSAGGKTSAGITPAGQAFDGGTAGEAVPAGRTTAGGKVSAGRTTAGPASAGRTRSGEPSGLTASANGPAAGRSAASQTGPGTGRIVSGMGGTRTPSSAWNAEEKELEAIFTRTYGEPKRRLPAESGARRVSYDARKKNADENEADHEEYLLVDGYNIIYAWEELRELAALTIDGARHRLMDIMCNYQGYTGCILILVFDAYKVEGNLGQAIEYHNIHVVYTKEAETADQYIEKLAHQMGRSHQVTVATSDGLEQLIIRGQGCRLLSARDLKEAVEYVNEQIRRDHLQQFPVKNGNYLFNHAEKDLRDYLEDVRLGKEEDHHGGKADKK